MADSAIAKRYADLSATQLGSIAANVAMLNKSQVETYLDNLATDINSELNGMVRTLTAADASVSVSTSSTAGSKGAATVGVAISAATGNLLELDEDGLKVIAPSAVVYSIAKKATANTGYAATYNLTADGVATGADIDIPKDMVVSGGEVKTVATADTPYTGAVVGDKYIELTIANASSDKLYIPVKDLVDVYTGAAAADGIITVAVSNANVITATIADASITDAKLAGSISASKLAGSIPESKLDSSCQTKIDNGDAAKTAVDGILEGAQSGYETLAALYTLAASKDANVQSDWNETDTDDDAYIKNKPTLGSLAALSEVAEANLASALATKINGKVDAVSGKDLSSNDFTDALKTKLEGIAAGAEVNVQADWDETSSSSDAFILNKPTLGTLAAKSAVAESDLDSSLGAKVTSYDGLLADVGAKVTAAAAVTIPSEDDVTLRSLRTAVVALKSALAATAA